MMRTVFLLTGFSNWGKTFLIKEIFNRKQFRRNSLYEIPGISGVEFCVQPQSNDDFGYAGYADDITTRLDELNANGYKPDYIFSAFCPTREPNNLSDKLIKQLYSNDRVYIIPIETKWCGHAHLDLVEIDKYFAPLSNVQVMPLEEHAANKGSDLVKLIKQCLKMP